MIENTRAAPAGTGRPRIESHFLGSDPTSGAALATERCAACREPAGPLHGSTVWRLCDNCRTLTRSPAALDVVRARITATLDAQRQASVRRAAR